MEILAIWNGITFRYFRKSCEKIHPVWNKLAKEANIFAELSRFKISLDSKRIKILPFD